MEYYVSHRQKIVISADDFGLSSRANRNIRHLISLGKIDRVAILVNGTFSETEVVEIIKSGTRMDIHLDSSNKFSNDPCKRYGVVMRGIYFIWKLLTRKLTSAKVEKDWRKQLEKFKNIFGRNPDGINSHEHIHLFPPFLKIALKLATEYSIPYIRFGDNVSVPSSNLSARIIHWLRLFNRKKFRRSQCVSSKSLISLDWIKNIDNFLDNLPEGQVEIVCHPEIADDFVKIKKYF